MDMTFDIDLILQIAGLAMGLLYLWWEYHANSRMWIVGAVMPMVSMWLYFRKGLYADFAINIYYLAMALYGYIAWTFGFARRKKPPLPVRHARPVVSAASVGVLLVVWALLYLWLEYLTDSNVPVADAFTTAGSIVGTWMLARKYIEQWIYWIAVDTVCVVLYIYKQIPFYAVLYAVYTVVAVFGYFKWVRLARENRPA